MHYFFLAAANLWVLFSQRRFEFVDREALAQTRQPRRYQQSQVAPEFLSV